MKFVTPAGPNPIDQGRVIGKATDRIDGPMKVTGTAPYAYERNNMAPNAVYGFIVGSTIATGRIVSIDSKAVEKMPGVLAVVTYKNAGTVNPCKTHSAKMLAGPTVEHFDQAVALVIAKTFEQARDGAKQLRVKYAANKGKYDLAAVKDEGVKPPDRMGTPADTRVGDFATAFAAAPVQVDSTYTTPDHSHSAMEPHATIASWKGDKIHLWTSNQMIAWTVRDTAIILGVKPEQIHVSSPFVGGGFGSKLFVFCDAILGAIGSRIVGKPVKVVLARPQMPNNTTHRPATIQRVRLGASQDGKLLAISHESWSGNLPGGSAEMAAQQTRLLYAGANRQTTHRLAHLDLPQGNAMRAPGEAVGHLGLEVAMDELAEKLNMDPIQLRIVNDTQHDPEKGPSRPFSTRQLNLCLQKGGEAFGWSKRNPKPGQVRDGRWLVGLGVASALRNSPTMASAARVRLLPTGRIVVETDMTDIGTGSYTIIAQTAAEMMGVPLSQVTVKLAESNYPVSSGSGGQFGANSSTSGVYAACVMLRNAIAVKMGWDVESCQFQDGKVSSAGHSVTLAEAAGSKELVGEDKIDFGDSQKAYAQSSFGAHFVEVGVDSITGEIRIRRMLAAVTAGRVLNPKSARSQVLGGMVMGAGGALMEELVVDKRHGYFVNHDLGEYHVPVNADIRGQEVLFLEEIDDKSSPMKAKGIGELGICGVGAAVANAVYNATGIRVRDYPITLDKFLDKLPPLV